MGTRAYQLPTDGAFVLVGETERSDWSGTDQSGREVSIGYQTKRFYWSGEWSILIGRAPTNQDAKFVLATQRSVLIGRANGAF